MLSSVYGLEPISFNDQTNIYEFVYILGKIFIQSTLPSCWALKETRMIVIEDIPCPLDKLERRYKKMKYTEKDNANIEYIEDEIQDDYSDDSLFKFHRGERTYLFGNLLVCMRTMNLLNLSSNASMISSY